MRDDGSRRNGQTRKVCSRRCDRSAMSTYVSFHLVNYQTPFSPYYLDVDTVFEPFGTVYASANHCKKQITFAIKLY